MAHILFFFFFFFCPICTEWPRSFFYATPWARSGFLSVYIFFFFTLSSRTLNILHFFCWSSQVASCENILWTLTLIKPRLCLWTRTLNCPYMATVYPSRSRILYKFSKLQASRTILCVSGLSVNSPEISDQMGKYHPLLHLLAPVFQIIWTMTHSRWGYMCRFMEICSTFVGLSYCVVTLDEKQSEDRLNMGTFKTYELLQNLQSTMPLNNQLYF